jgi:hypothetical protein
VGWGKKAPATLTPRAAQAIRGGSSRVRRRGRYHVHTRFSPFGLPGSGPERSNGLHSAHGATTSGCPGRDVDPRASQRSVAGDDALKTGEGAELVQGRHPRGNGEDGHRGGRRRLVSVDRGISLPSPQGHLHFRRPTAAGGPCLCFRVPGLVRKTGWTVVRNSPGVGQHCPASWRVEEDAERSAAADRPRDGRFLVRQRSFPREPAAERGVRLFVAWSRCSRPGR